MLFAVVFALKFGFCPKGTMKSIEVPDELYERLQAAAVRAKTDIATFLEGTVEVQHERQLAAADLTP